MKKLSRSEIRSMHSYKSDKPSRTQQQFLEETNVNSIMEKYKKTGVITHTRRSGIPQYGDFTTYQDFKTQMNSVREAFEEFSQLPAFLRKKFANDPANLIDYLADENNHSEAVKLGLMELIHPPVDPQSPQNDDLTTKKGESQGSTKGDAQ